MSRDRDPVFERAVDAAKQTIDQSMKFMAPSRRVVANALAAAGTVYDQAQREFVDRQVAEAAIAGWNIDGDGMDLRITMARETAAGLVQAAKTFLTATGAKNYVEQQVIDRETGDRYTLTIQRPGAKTPHELRREAEAEVERLRAEIARLSGGDPR